MKSYHFPIPALAIALCISWILPVQCCNKALCASDVSKCLIQELCQCRPTDGNCSCCKECMLCLGTLWDECCDCVGMCNPRNYSDTPPTSKSTVEELHDPIPSLFRALTEVDGIKQLNWNIVSFPAVEELSHHENLVSFLDSVNQPQHQNVSVPQNGAHVVHSNDKEHMCTVVYFDDCMSIHQCKNSCTSMGASKYRWFHNACCECVGPECIDYGSKTVKCMNCMVWRPDLSPSVFLLYKPPSLFIEMRSTMKKKLSHHCLPRQLNLEGHQDISYYVEEYDIE